MENISLAQFERIDGLRNAARYDADPANEARHQSRLFNELIDLLGYEAANDIPSLEEYADTLITECLIGKIEVIDEVAA